MAIALFESIRSFVICKRKQNPNLDGRAFWQPIKNILSEYDHIIVGEWIVNPIIETIIDNYPEYDSHGVMNEKNHFIHQLYRIPKTEEANLRKLAQVALNLGQLESFGLPEELENISFSVNTFINLSDIKQFMSDNNILRRVEAVFEKN